MMLLSEEEEAKFAAALLDRLPKTMRVGAYEFRIKKMSSARAAGERRFGECSICEQAVSIQDWMPSRCKAVDTFIHELLHALYWAWGIEDEDKEERIVNVLGPAWTAFYRDNPWFLDWIKSAEL